MSKKKSRRGFASMDPETHRAVSAQGGRSAHAKGVGRKFTHEQAVAAGRKAGQAGHEQGTAHGFTAEAARAGGSKGGQANVGDRPVREAQAERALGVLRQLCHHAGFLANTFCSLRRS